eukprot:CAMPEP_0172179868 /NCGR_PEP_ID=MMETSP1050-20130122/16874_1 /TAXON_ID=233186 /ORGANISM="Cryptomonas curvata, Strain CCAP979/52" /LENGTH=371 /DNA_ID=CAMNT_0012852833 /DNA_START=1 /DNA_END=1114 /DNA_ORIENTATION=+
MHWFELLNNCAALAAAFPEARGACQDSAWGRDLPAFRVHDSTLLVNAKPRGFAASCGSQHPMTAASADAASDGAARRRRGRSTPSTTCSPPGTLSGRWYMHLWFGQSGMPGRLTRLLTAAGPDDLALGGPAIPTHVAPPALVPRDPGYTPYNKPSAVNHWLRKARPTEDVIIVVDPDCMFIRPLDIVVEEGSPIAQQAFYHFNLDSDEIPMQIARRYCKNCTFLDPIAVPMIIHRRDLERIAPLWLAKTIEIRNDRHNWPNCWDNRTCGKMGLGWVAEMLGYVFAASELGIRHEIWQLQDVPPVHKQLTSAIVHYHVKVPLPDGRGWYKHDDDACCNIPWPLPPGTDNLTTTVITKLHEAHELLGEYNHTW